MLDFLPAIKIFLSLGLVASVVFAVIWLWRGIHRAGYQEAENRTQREALRAKDDEARRLRELAEKLEKIREGRDRRRGDPDPDRMFDPPA